MEDWSQNAKDAAKRLQSFVESNAYRNGLNSARGARCPFNELELAKAWIRGRNQKRRIARKDLRPHWRRTGEQKRYTPKGI